MKIAAQELFHTPADWKELHDWIDAHSPEDRAHLTVAAVMAWNLAAKITNKNDEVAA